VREAVVMDPEHETERVVWNNSDNGGDIARGSRGKACCVTSSPHRPVPIYRREVARKSPGRVHSVTLHSKKKTWR